MFKLAVPRGRRISVYLAADALKLVQPWVTGRARSARISTIVSRYADAAARRPQLSLVEASVLVQLLGPLASIDDIAGLWAQLLDRRREGRLLPNNVDAEELAGKVRQLSVGEQLGLLELADRTAMGAGTLRERLIAAGIGERA